MDPSYLNSNDKKEYLSIVSTLEVPIEEYPNYISIYKLILEQNFNKDQKVLVFREIYSHLYNPVDTDNIFKGSINDFRYILIKVFIQYLGENINKLPKQLKLSEYVSSSVRLTLFDGLSSLIKRQDIFHTAYSINPIFYKRVHDLFGANKRSCYSNILIIEKVVRNETIFKDYTDMELNVYLKGLRIANNELSLYDNDCDVGVYDNPDDEIILITGEYFKEKNFFLEVPIECQVRGASLLIFSASVCVRGKQEIINRLENTFANYVKQKFNYEQLMNKASELDKRVWDRWE